MKLNELFPQLIGETTIEITHLQNNSQAVSPGDLFIAYPGNKSDGRQYILQALEKGAAAVLYEAEDLPADLQINPNNCFAVPNLLVQLPHLVSQFYDNPGKAISVIGVTGTNGKTTIAYQLAQAYNLLKKPTAYVGTLGQGSPDKLTLQNNTTPDNLTLQKLLRDYITADYEQVSMEVSSHALIEDRVYGIDFEQAIFTNLTLDHLDFHGTMEEYAAAKARLFAVPTLKTAIINSDDPYATTMMKELRSTCTLITYGINNTCDIQALNWQVGLGNTLIQVKYPCGIIEVLTKNIGHFNIYNALAIFASLYANGQRVETIKEVMALLNPAPGRMEVVSTDPISVVDYAHTPDALENVLKTLNELKKNRLILVFGCGGDRDKSKRPIMGAIAEKYAEIVIITSDNPRTEAIETIIEDIKAGITRTQNIVVESNRRKAIIMALQLATPRDIILVAGKGHETYQQIGNTKYPFSDTNVIREQMINI